MTTLVWSAGFIRAFMWVWRRKRDDMKMDAVVNTPFERALDTIDQLSPTDQDAVIEIVRKRQIAQRRSEIAANAKDTLQAFREGRAIYGTIDDLHRDLQAND